MYLVALYNILSIPNDKISTKIYDKPTDIDFDIVHFPFWMTMSLELHPMVIYFSINSFS